MKPEQRDMLRPREIVQRLNDDRVGGLTEYSLYRLLHTGAIPARKPGRCYIVSYQAVLDYLRCTDGHGDITPPPVAETGSIRPIG